MLLYKRLLHYVKPYVSQILLAALCTALATACTLMVAPFVGFVFKVIEDKNILWLNYAALGMLGLYFVKGLFTYGQEYLSYFVINRVIVDLRNKVYEHLQDMSLDFYTRWNTGELVSRTMNDIATLQTALFAGFVAIVPQSALLVGLLVYIFWLNWRLSLLTLIALPLIIHVIRLFAHELREISEGVQQKTADLTSHLTETISQIRVVKSFSMEKRETDKFRKETEKFFGVNMRAVQILATQSPVIALLQAAAIIAIVWYGGVEIINGSLTLPKLIAFATALGIMTDPGNTLSKAYSIIQQGMASAKRIFEITDITPSIKDAANAIELPNIHGAIEFQNISFAYEKENVLRNISFFTNPGEMIAIVGRTGSGKSTVMNLLLRFFDPSAGRILIDGFDIKQVKIASLRRQIAVVPQEIALFRGTIGDNIAYGKMDAGQEEIVSAAKLANIHYFIDNLPEKYNTEVGERGVKLSGGERQRIAIARAILRDPRILILDEATSSLDAETELLIREALERLMHGRTSFVVAHRLYTVEKAHKIIVLDNGRIVEAGTHSELIAKNGLYRHLFEIQFRNKA
ncbi:MAG: ABC transporter ATP-binding protein [Candidatus Margulisbacteria bacterium]|nr:ABC transporter ATP-binding protein [Candidatus Margulisiibacteriota bacterium]